MLAGLFLQKLSNVIKLCDNIAASQFIKRHKLLKEVAPHIPDHMDRTGEASSRFMYTDDQIRLTAKNHNTIIDFIKKDSYLYQAARRRVILEDVCAHMKMSKGVSFHEKELFQIIKQTYFNIEKLRHRKISIQDKPFIYGFDIDIFIPELRVGIEFDGTYYHSFEYMRKSKAKAKWSDEDIKNYHLIKDTYFLSQSIEIIHVKEEDWIKNKQEQIDRVLEFLSKKS